MFALYLNPMMSNCETAVCVAIANTEQELHDLVNNENVEMYTDTGADTFNGGNKSYQKCFKKDGILEWFNHPSDSFCEPNGVVEIPSLADIQDGYQKLKDDEINMWYQSFGGATHL